MSVDKVPQQQHDGENQRATQQTTKRKGGASRTMCGPV